MNNNYLPIINELLARLDKIEKYQRELKAELAESQREPNAEKAEIELNNLASFIHGLN